VKALSRLLISGMLLLVGLVILSAPKVEARQLAQQPTVAIPTVTGTPTGPLVRVNADNDFIRVRSGPGGEYIQVGLMIAGEKASAYGKNAEGTWIQIAYPGVEGGIGWVYSPLVTILSGGDLSVVEPPPTATPRVTPTVDPTVAAQFINEAPPTRQPTYTAPPQLVIPTIEPSSPTTTGVGFPIGLVIVLLGAVGILGALFALIRGR
jgi:uncharacterized protein YraI